MINFGAIIKKYRELENITQKDLSDDVDITATYLSAIENDRKEPSLALLRKICGILDVPSEVLFWEAVELKDGLNREDKKIIEGAKEIIKNYYENVS